MYVTLSSLSDREFVRVYWSSGKPNPNESLSAGPSAPAASSATVSIYSDYTIPASPTTTPTYNSHSGSPNAIPTTSQGTIHTVLVSDPGQLLYNSPFIAAQPRGTFQFQQKNHTVTQSSFADPCRMLATGGFVIIVTRLTTDG
ncbi:hypothetical protein H2248_000714 [Termitomyces sp. 'cryptogamus']|nr:hypothetical protein H2248_000714 [Termitomyces sp. 'cryptogamus']